MRRAKVQRRQSKLLKNNWRDNVAQVVIIMDPVLTEIHNRSVASYYSLEFDEYLVIEKRMKKTCSVVIMPKNGGIRFRRMKRNVLAAYLMACKFKRFR